MASLGQDKSTNRVAICSAIVAGFAYVGYAVVKRVFGGKRGEEGEEMVVRAAGGLTGFFRNEEDLLGLDYEPGEGGRRVFLRRLSGSHSGGRAQQTWLGAGGEGGASVLRPLSVRERIRELNLNALAFTDTLLILHGHRPKLSGPRSLPSSAMHSPTRIISPGDLSLEFLQAQQEEYKRSLGYDTNDNSVCGSPHSLSRHPSRRSLARRSLGGSVVSLGQAEQEEADSRAAELCQEKEQELTRRLEGFQSSRPRELTPYESRSLVALLHCTDRAKIARTLVTASNLAAFSRNQELLREAGILVRLPSLLAGPDKQVGSSLSIESSQTNVKSYFQVKLDPSGPAWSSHGSSQPCPEHRQHAGDGAGGAGAGAAGR